MCKCELCETITNKNQLSEYRSIIKTGKNTYELALWQPIDKDITDSIYEIYTTTEIKCCPDCGRKLGEI